MNEKTWQFAKEAVSDSNRALIRKTSAAAQPPFSNHYHTEKPLQDIKLIHWVCCVTLVFDTTIQSLRNPLIKRRRTSLKSQCLCSSGKRSEVNRVETLPGRRCLSGPGGGKPWELHSIDEHFKEPWEPGPFASSFWSDTLLRGILQSLYFGTEREHRRDGEHEDLKA